MAKLLQRIPLSSLPLIDLSDVEIPETPAPSSLPLAAPSFRFDNSPLPGYGTALPATDVDFAFPADDQRRVEAWFSGDFSHVTIPESSTLKKNMRAAVISALSSFLSAARSRNLFSSPFLIAWRYRLFDDSLSPLSAPALLVPAPEAPDMIVTGYKVYEKSLHTEVTFSRFPSKLMVNIPIPENAGDYIGIITAIEFLITSPVDLYPSSPEVSGLKSISVDGVRERVWLYEHYEADALLAAARADSDFRVIASIPFSEIAEGQWESPSPLPIHAGALSNFTSLPKASQTTSSSSRPADSSSHLLSGYRPFLHFSTPPISLSRPEQTKRITDLFLRGIFQRDEVTMTLYGSHHRENWRLIARTRGPYIRGLHSAPYKWFRVEISLPLRPSDLLDALSFRFLPGPSHL